jgi:hypothetical protein
MPVMPGSELTEHAVQFGQTRALISGKVQSNNNCKDGELGFSVRDELSSICICFVTRD